MLLFLLGIGASGILAQVTPQESVDLQFINQIQANNTTVSLSATGNWPAFNGSQMDFTNVATLPNGQTIDLRATVESVTGPFVYQAIVPDFNQGDLGFLYANTALGVGGFTLRLNFYAGGGTFTTPYVMPKLRLTFYDVDGESIQSEGVRVFRDDGFSGYELPSGDLSVTLTEENGGDSFLFTGPGSNRSETDRSGAFMLDFTNTASLRLSMHSNTSGGSANNPMFAAIDGDLSQIDSTGLAPQITQEPADLTLLQGEGGSFAVTATGAPPLRYQWKKGDTAIPGATNATYAISSAQFADEDYYSVTVQNNYGAIFSRSARLNVYQQIVSPDQIQLYGLTGFYTGQPRFVTATSTDFSTDDFRIEYEAPGYPKTTNAPVAAGSYQVTASVVKPGFGGSRTGTLRIDPAPLSITADSFVRLYGETNPVLTYRFSGWVNGETETVLTAPVLISTLADSGSQAGLYDIVVSGATAPNYAISFLPGQLTVLGSLANVISFSAVSGKTYGDAPFTLDATASSGLPVSFVSSDPAIAEISGNQVTVRGAGVVTLTAQQAGNANYVAAEDVSINLTIQPKALTVSGITAQNRPYNGTLAVSLVLGAPALSGVLEGDEVSLLTAGAEGRLADPAPGTGKWVEVIGLQLAGADAAHYALTLLLLPADISRRPLTVVAEDKNRRYLEENPELTWTAMAPGLAQGDRLEVASISTAATLPSVPGSYPITLSGVAILDAAGLNVTSRYVVTPQDGVLTVAKGIQTISFAVLPDKTYGDAPYVLTATASSGLPVTLESENPAQLEINGSQATVRGAGSFAVTARQAGSELWETAAPVSRMQTIHPKDVTVAARSLEIQLGQTPQFAFDVLTPLAPGDTQGSVFTDHPTDPARHFGAGWLLASGWNPTLTGDFPITRSHLQSPANYRIAEFRPGVLTVWPGPGVAAGSISPLAGGQNHSLLLRQSDGIATWGNLDAGLGQVPGGLTGIAGVAAGSSAPDFSLAWKTDGTVAGWGDNTRVVDPAVLGSLSGVVGLAGGANHALALKTNGTVQVWGTNAGQLNVPLRLTATNQAGFVRAVAVSASQDYSAVLRADGTVLAWGILGSSLASQLDENSVLSVSNAVAIAAGPDFILGIQSDGRVFYRGNAGLSFPTERSQIPASLTSAASVATNPAVAVAVGVSHCLALRRDGSVLAWGDGPADKVTMPPGLTNVSAVGAGNGHSLLLLRTGEVRVAAAPNDVNLSFSSHQLGAIALGGPDSDGDGWSNEAELRAGSDPLALASRPRKVAFTDGTAARTFVEGPADTGVGSLRVIDAMGWADPALLPGVTLAGPDAARFRLENGQLKTAVPLDYDHASAPRTFSITLASGGRSQDFVLQLADDPNDEDVDGDGLSNAQEIALGTDPHDADTDDDGLSDGVETGSGVYVSAGNTGTNPLVADTDGDGRSDGSEIAAGISPVDGTSYPGKPATPPQTSVAGNGDVTFSFSRILPLGSRYQLQSSSNLGSWINVGTPVQGTGGEVQFTGVSRDPKLFYRIIAVP